jgi:hypothetical protein
MPILTLTLLRPTPQTGYYTSLLDFMRGKKKNVSWMFENDLLAIPM